MATDAFWVKDNKIVDVGGRTHIQHIIQEPEFFGLAKTQVTAMYKKYREQMYTEGKAREELIKLACKDGWIRVRQYTSRQNEHWSIQFDSYRKRKNVVQNFILWALSKTLLTKYDLLVLVGFEDNYHEEVQSSDLLKEGELPLARSVKPQFQVIHFSQESN